VYGCARHEAGIGGGGAADGGGLGLGFGSGDERAAEEIARRLEARGRLAVHAAPADLAFAVREPIENRVHRAGQTKVTYIDANIGL
jgi:hypothetical protein